MNEMKGNSMAVFNSNDIYPVSADSELPFEQHRDIFHLTGIDQEETILLLYPPSKDCLLYTSPSPRDMRRSRMPSSA